MTSSLPLTHHIALYLKTDLTEARGCSPKTYKSYKTTLKLFGDFIAVEQKKHFFKILTNELSYEHVYNFLLHHQRVKKWKPATWNQRLGALRSFVNFLARTDLQYIDLSRRVGLIDLKAVKNNNQDYMPLAEFEAALAKLPDISIKNFRNKLIFQLLFFTGIRIEEFTGIRFQDIVTVRRGCLNLYVHGKGNKGRNIPLMEKATIKNIQYYIELISKRGANSEYIFCGNKGARITEEAIRKVCRLHFNPLIENKHITPHSFRHSAAMHWLESGIEIFQLSKLLGHKNTKTTAIYLHATFGIKVDALIRGGQNKKLSKVFKPTYSSNEEYWDSLNIKF